MPNVLNEIERRAPAFDRGYVVRMADGQSWYVPDPPMAARREDWASCHYDALLLSLREVQDGAEQLRAELALAIHLLRSNYDLDAQDLQQLLGFPRGSMAQVMAQRVFHQVAIDHLAAADAAELALDMGEPVGSWWARLLALVPLALRWRRLWPETTRS